jgi:hypothetical protein
MEASRRNNLQSATKPLLHFSRVGAADFLCDRRSGFPFTIVSPHLHQPAALFESVGSPIRQLGRVSTTMGKSQLARHPVEVCFVPSEISERTSKAMHRHAFTHGQS